jgi:hypothetical protein
MGELLARQQQLLTLHPKAPDASLERLRQLAGIVALKGAVPSGKFLEEPGEEGQGEPETST